MDRQNHDSVIAAEATTDVHHGAPRCLLGLFDAAATGLADWSEFDEEAERWGVEVRGLSREDLAALIEGSTHDIPIAEHRRLLQEASDFVRWGRRGGIAPRSPVVRLHALLQARHKPHFRSFFSVVPTACARTGSRRPGRRS